MLKNTKQIPMPHNLAPLDRLLDDYSPCEIALMLDEALYDMVMSTLQTEDYETLPKRYSGMMTLRNHFAMMDDKLSSIWK